MYPKQVWIVIVRDFGECNNLITFLLKNMQYFDLDFLEMMIHESKPLSWPLKYG